MATIGELLATEAAIDKLGARGITIEQAHQVLRNANTTIGNPRSNPPGERQLLIGRTDGGRVLTLVIERTSDPTTWLIVTGWDATDRERRIPAAEYGQRSLERPRPTAWRLRR